MSKEISRETAFARAYRITAAALDKPGAHGRRILIGDIQRLAGLSATPVREALSRLVGEGLLDEQRGGGYYLPRPDAPDIVELFDLSRVLALAAIEAAAKHSTAFRTRGLDSAQGEPPTAADAAIAYWLERLAIVSGNRTLATETRRLNLRMRSVRQAQAAIFTLADEASVLANLVDKLDIVRLKEWVERYARHGEAAAEPIANWLSG